VVYDFCESRSGEHPRRFLEIGNDSWQGKLVCDYSSAYKALFTRGVVEVGCWHTPGASCSSCM